MKRKSTGNITPLKADATDWARVYALRDQDILHDPDSPRTSVADWDGAVLKQGGVAVGAVRRRGPGKKPAKVPTTLRLSAETLAAWKATGPGWQTRMADVLARPDVMRKAV